MRQRLAKRLVPDLSAVVLVSAFAAENGARSCHEDLEIKPERPGLRVPEIQANHVVETHTTTPAHLPQSGNARLRFKNASTMPDVIDCIFIRDRRPRANQRHLTGQHVPKLGKLVKARFPQKSPKWRHARIVCDLVHGRLPGCSLTVSSAGNKTLAIFLVNFRIV